MRATASDNGISVRAFGGTTGVLLAFNVDEARRDDLLGFAVERSGGNRPTRFLSGLLHFPGHDHAPGVAVSSAEAPLQRFRWSDYGVYPETEYSYTVHAVTGDPGSPELEPGPTVDISTASADAGKHRVLFNRAAAASQAFSRDFPEVEEELDAARAEDRRPVLPPRALAWLSRGLLQQVTGICELADGPGWALDIAIYEYELPAIVEAVSTAYERGARVRIVYHAGAGDDETAENEKSLRGWPEFARRARLTSAICHDKFIVASKLDGDRRVPVSVLCGSTNFTENGVYRQANVTHVVEDEQVAGQYLSLFEQLFSGADPAATKDWIDANNPLSAMDPVTVGFSPRSGRIDLDLIAAEISKAARDVLFCTAFDLDDQVEKALLGGEHDDILRLGLENSSSQITGFHRDRTADFVATAMLNTGLEGFLKESMAGQRGRLLIHTKLVVIDFTSDQPTVISGSHNLSNNASGSNDENFLILRGLVDVADCYGVEAMRLYEHYRFRWHQKHPETAASSSNAKALKPNSSWTDPYFEAGSLACLDRLRFAGASA